MYLSKARLGALALLFALIFCAIGAGTALAVQGNMTSAKMHLNYALTDLNNAKPDKNGHRSNAIQLVKEAITQVNLGIQAGAQ
jgi:hypothetical protein